MQARLNKGYGPYSSGTRVNIVQEYDHYDVVYVKLVIAPYTEFSVPRDYLTLCRVMTDEVPANNRQKRRMKEVEKS